MAFIKTPEELLDADITAGQFRILIHLIRYSLDDGHSYIGYTKLAAACRTSKGSIIKSIKELESMGFLEITHRGTFSRSNDIKLTLENGLNRCRMTTGELTSGTSVQGSLNESLKGSLNNTPKGTQKESQGSLNETPYIDNRFKYLDLNLNTHETGSLNESPEGSGEESKKAPADGAAGRSMPKEGLAKEVLAEGSQLDIEDLCLWQAFKEAFPKRYPWFQLVRAGKKIGLRGIGKMGDTLLDRVWTEVFGWFELRGVPVEKLKLNTRFNNEIIIKEAA